MKQVFFLISSVLCFSDLRGMMQVDFLNIFWTSAPEICKRIDDNSEDEVEDDDDDNEEEEDVVENPNQEEGIFAGRLA